MDLSGSLPLEFKVFSQFGEDGVTVAIFKIIGFLNRYYVEFGCENGMECNTRILRQYNICSGLLMDGSNENPEINLRKEFITAENIVSLFEKYAVPKMFDLFSLDIDFNDWYVMRNILEANYRPSVCIVEYNSHHLPTEDKIVVYNSSGSWDGTQYFGASLLALQKLFTRYGYTLIYATEHGVNAFFVQNRFVHQLLSIFPHSGTIEEIFNFPKYGYFNNGHPKDPLKRPYVTAESLLNSTNES